MKLVEIKIEMFQQLRRDERLRTKLAVVFSSLGMFMLFSLSGCFLLPPFPPPRTVGAVLSLDKDGILKIDYMPCIKESSYFSGRYYVLDGLTVREQCTHENLRACGGGSESLMWDLGSGPRMFSRDGVPLPQSLRYGDKIPGTSVEAPAMPLQVNTDYNVTVGITGFKGRDEGGRSFFSVADFRIEPDGKGGLKLIEQGGQSCQIKGVTD